METFTVTGLATITLEARVTVRCPRGGRDRLRVVVTYAPRNLAIEARSFRYWFAGRVAFAEQIVSDLAAAITAAASPVWVRVEAGHGTEGVEITARAYTEAV